MPTFSIVTINYNNLNGLINTSKSITPLLNEDIEWIIIDGLSNDGSIQYIKNESKVTKYLIEKDDGIYDAMNKGIELVTGELVIFMNSGDAFHPNFSFNKLKVKLKNYDLSKCIIYGDTLKKVARIYYLDKVQDSKNKWWESVIPCHQSILMPSDFLKKNKFDTTLEIFSDRINIHTAFNEIKNHININLTISIYEVGGISSIGGKSLRSLHKIVNEFIMVNAKNKSALFKIKLYIKLYVKFLLIKVIGYKLYYGLVFSLKSAKLSHEE